MGGAQKKSEAQQAPAAAATSESAPAARVGVGPHATKMMSRGAAASGAKGKQCRPRASNNEGWHGWDQYASFYDWENARTVGRRDVHFWQALAQAANGPILELGCGTGRVTLPVGRVVSTPLTGIDRSESMLAYARRRLRRTRGRTRVTLVQGDIRALPFRFRPGFHLVMAPYGILQSLVRESDLTAALRAVADVLAPGGLFGIDLVPDLPAWSEYRNRVRLRGFRRRTQSHVTLVESVRQDRRRRLTIFDQAFIERRRGLRKRHLFSLTFRTLSIPQMRRRLERVGLRVEAVLGDYQNGPWNRRADVWLILARKMGEGGISLSSLSPPIHSLLW